MKIRNGFVSNSSSSSFVIAKTYLTEEQIDAFRKWHDDTLAEVGSEGFDEHGDSFQENKYYIQGTYYYVGDSFEQMIKRYKVNRKYLITDYR